MGAFFTNIQVRAGERDGDIQQEIAIALRQLASEYAFEEVDPVDISADRYMMIGPANTGGWIAIYDSVAEFQDEAVLGPLAHLLSITVEGSAVSVSVYDSDVLRLELWRSGQHLDSYSSSPASFRDSHPEEWQELLVDGATPAELREVWGEPLLFAEAMLSRTAELLGMDQAQCSIGLRYLLEDTDEESIAAFEAAGYRVLAFRSTVQPATVEQSVHASSLPVLMIQSGAAAIEASIDDTLTWATCAAANTGGESVGLQVAIWGSALDSGILAIDALQVSTPAGMEAGPTWVSYKPVFSSVDGVSVRVIHLPDYPLVANTSNWDNGGSSKARQTHQARMLQQIGVRIQGRGLAIGQGELHVGFVPLENAYDGQTSWTFSVQVFRRSRRPLRSIGGSPTTDRLLRDLDQPRVLIALMALGADRPTSAEVAESAIARWNRAVAMRSVDRYDGSLYQQFDYRPLPFELPAHAIPDGPPWQHVRHGLERNVSVFAALAQPLSDDPLAQPSSSAGFSYEADSPFLQDGDDNAAPQLALWWDTTGHDSATIARMTHVLLGIVDDAMHQAEGLQALVARWNWTNFQSLQSTPYELACGVHGQCTTSRDWCSQWLRGVSERMWLGPDLLAHLSDIAALGNIAECAPVGPGIRAMLKPGETLDGLELVLAPLLPGESDWHAGMCHIYRRSSDEFDVAA
jgi:hypothetical protein